jgi:hypothetical protein
MRTGTNRTGEADSLCLAAVITPSVASARLPSRRPDAQRGHQKSCAVEPTTVALDTFAGHLLKMVRQLTDEVVDSCGSTLILFGDLFLTTGREEA